LIETKGKFKNKNRIANKMLENLEQIAGTTDLDVILGILQWKLGFKDLGENSSKWDKLALEALLKGEGSWTPGTVRDDVSQYFDDKIDGANLDLCSGFYPHVKGSVGLDVSQLALFFLREIGKKIQRPYSSALLFELNSTSHRNPLPFDDNTFGSATMIFGWNYIDPIEEVVREVDRVVSPRGNLYVVQARNPIFEPNMAYRADGSQEIQRKLEQMGYKSVIESICHDEKIKHVDSVKIQFT